MNELDQSNEVSRIISREEEDNTGSLDLSSLELKEIPEDVYKLVNLEELNLENNEISTVPLCVAKLKNLKYFCVSHNRIKTISDGIGKLSKLEILEIDGNQLTSLPKSITKLKNLVSLDVQENHLKKLPEDIYLLQKLQKLDAFGNRLVALPIGIGSLRRLTELHLDSNQIRRLPKEIGRLENLKSLNLFGNKLKQLPDSLSKLKNLEILDLENNELDSLPKGIEQLKFLSRLALGANHFTEFPEHLFHLDLNVCWRGETGIVVSNNPLQKPPIEIVKQGTIAVRKYFKEIDKGSTVRLFEAKVLIVGQGGVGKTCLMKKITNKSFENNSKSTEGIDIQKYYVQTPSNEDCRVNFWDFGGQEIYHATHQFFLTKRSLYLLVWEARKDLDLLGFDYWLNTIKVLSKSSPVLIIQNKIDERRKTINQGRWKSQFPNIIDNFNVSAFSGEGLEELKNAISANIANLPHIGDELPKKWVEIRKKLEKLNDNFISFSRYKKICEEFDLDTDKVALLCEYYHDLGIFLHFKENPILQNTIFLKPHWATNAVYKVLDDKKVIESGGKFSFHDLKDIWSDEKIYPENIFVGLVELMKNFELCFEIPGVRQYIIPELLPGDQPELNLKKQDYLWFQYQYDFMPAGILTRLIVKLHDLIKDNLYWKDGVVLKWEDTEALIFKTTSRRIEVFINGNEKITVLGIIRRHMKNINAPFENLRFDEMVKCSCLNCSQDDRPHFFPYTNLIKARDKRIASIQCQKYFNDVSVRFLLEGLNSWEEHRGNLHKIKIFLASSGELKEERDQIELLLGKENKKLIPKNLYLDLVIWEDLKHSFNRTRIQDYFNEEMLKCDVVICLFHRIVGNFTIEEFDTAYESLKNGHRPFFLYTYFKKIRIESDSSSLYDFNDISKLKEKIRKAEQIYCSFTSNSDLKLQLINQIDHIVNYFSK